jgi:hypothetical protein
MKDEDLDAPLSEAELDADRPGENLTELLADTKASAGHEPDWETIDEKLFSRIEAERAARSSKEQRGGKVLWVAFAGTLAAAAAALLFMKSGPIAPVAIDDAAHAGSFLSARGATVQVGGAVAHEGQSIAAGDRLDARDGSPLFQQEGRVVFDLEKDSTVSVQHAASPLVLSLERGATEAQVTPVPNGEAFAVDITAQGGAVARVAVHGTHLRVARAGDHVVVDLTEGVVSVGTPARRGSTYGSLVTAPAHVEFDIADLEHSLVVDHGAATVRSADALAPEVKTAAVSTHNASARPPGVRHDEPPRVDHVTATAAAVVTAPKLSNVDPAPAVIEANPSADQDLAAAVRACVSAIPHAPEVTVTISSTLSLKVGDDGFVQAARFDPPLPVDAQECAARSIYRKTRFVHGGDVSVPIVITR